MLSLTQIYRIVFNVTKYTGLLHTWMITKHKTKRNICSFLFLSNEGLTKLSGKTWIKFWMKFFTLHCMATNLVKIHFSLFIFYFINSIPRILSNSCATLAAISSYLYFNYYTCFFINQLSEFFPHNLEVFSI